MLNANQKSSYVKASLISSTNFIRIRFIAKFFERKFKEALQVGTRWQAFVLQQSFASPETASC